MKRVLIVVLTLLIGSPVCWCCVSRCALPSVDEDACPMCVESDTVPSKDECPCDHGCSARELTQPDIALPATRESWVPSFVAVPDGLGFQMRAEFVREAVVVFHETGPPPPGRALYRMYCAMLN